MKSPGIIHLADIPEEGLRVEERASLADPYRDEGVQCSLEALSLRVEKAGTQVLVRGSALAQASLLCGRCLEPFPFPIDMEVDVKLRPRPVGREGKEEIELSADDLGVGFYEGDVVDLDALLKEELLLTLPMKPLCRPNCQGLCPTCGVNRNHGTCSCAPDQGDSPFASLRTIAEKLTPRFH